QWERQLVFDRKFRLLLNRVRAHSKNHRSGILKRLKRIAKTFCLKRTARSVRPWVEVKNDVALTLKIPERHLLTRIRHRIKDRRWFSNPGYRFRHSGSPEKM